MSAEIRLDEVQSEKIYAAKMSFIPGPGQVATQIAVQRRTIRAGYFSLWHYLQHGYVDMEGRMPSG